MLCIQEAFVPFEIFFENIWFLKDFSVSLLEWIVIASMLPTIPKYNVAITAASENKKNDVYVLKFKKYF